MSKPGAVAGSRRLIELLDDAVIARGVDGVITAWSAAAEDLYGYAAGEMLGRAYSVIVPVGRRASERDVNARVCQGDLAGRYATARSRKDGVVVDVSVSIEPVRDDTGMVVGVSTNEHRVDEDGAGWTSDAEAYLRGAFEDAPIGIALVSIEPGLSGRFLRVNRAMCELTGHSAGELQGMNVAQLLHPDDVEPDGTAMAGLVDGEVEGFQLEQRLIHAGRHTVWALVNASLVHGPSREPLYCIRQLQNIEDRKRFEGELGYLADHDPLTGLLNRRGFVRGLTHEIAGVRRYGGGGGVLFFDIDDFKQVNDTLGHSVGDELLSDVARVVYERLRETDVFARLGGDEFAVMLPHAIEKDALALGESVLDAVRSVDLGTLGAGRQVTASLGVTTFAKPGKDLTADDILIDADLAMYAAKDAGKNRVAVATVANHERMRSRVTWAERVRNALATDLFELHCQPIVDLQTDLVTQFELLLRLPGEGGELILPSQFLYTAERSGSILEVDRWVLGRATALIAEHHAAGRDLRLHVNLSGRSVGDSELPGFIERELATTGINPASLVLEVTETAAIANLDRARKFATRLTEIGCMFALDDFGAGFGSFYYLKYIPFDYVKIDGEFIRHLPASSTDQLILDSVVQMSSGLGKRTIAEFAGDQQTLDVLKEHQVDFAQGYHLGRPEPVSVALAL
jgi:diguanylate cyclase (GGDEF)-like protein/PAS domain S-box-containing protein